MPRFNFYYQPLHLLNDLRQEDAISFSVSVYILKKICSRFCVQTPFSHSREFKLAEWIYNYPIKPAPNDENDLC